MRLRLLGSAAGGGHPQWNCGCAGCRTVRDGHSGPRTHCSLAFTGDGREWHLIRAGPDVASQIERFPPLHPGPAVRETPLRSVLLTDAELDATIGLLILREGSSFDVYGTATVLEALAQAFPVQRVLESYAHPRWSAVAPGRRLELEHGRLRVSAFRLGTRSPRYVSGRQAGGDWVVGYRLVDAMTGGSAVFAPGVERWSVELEAALDGVDCAFIDGTFWSDDELAVRGAGHATAASMGHLPIGGDEGSARRLAALGLSRTVYVHLNNTNPVLDERSAERGCLSDLGIEVGEDGMEVEA